MIGSWSYWLQHCSNSGSWIRILLAYTKTIIHLSVECLSHREISTTVHLHLGWIVDNYSAMPKRWRSLIKSFSGWIRKMRSTESSNVTRVLLLFLNRTITPLTLAEYRMTITNSPQGAMLLSYLSFHTQRLVVE